MNEEYILKLAAPHIIDGLLTYDKFDIIYGSTFKLREQYIICDILHNYGIKLVPDDDEKIVNAAPSVNNTQIKLEEPIFVNERINQTNIVLCTLIQEGNRQAKQDLCIKNEYLVMKYAIKYKNLLGNDLEVDDLKQAGMIGMLEAAKRFNSTLGYSFSTYATCWIKQAISREIANLGFKIRLPVHMIEQIKKFNYYDRMFYMKGELNYRSRIERVANIMKISFEQIKYIIEVRDCFLNNVSLDTPIGEDGETTLIEMIPIEEETPFEEKVAFLELRQILDKVLSMLKPKEAKILRLRFGLDDGITHTLESIGKYFGLTRERIRQIEAKALDKLRKSNLRNKLDGHIN